MASKEGLHAKGPSLESRALLQIHSAACLCLEACGITFRQRHWQDLGAGVAMRSSL